MNVRTNWNNYLNSTKSQFIITLGLREMEGFWIADYLYYILGRLDVQWKCPGGRLR